MKIYLFFVFFICCLAFSCSKDDAELAEEALETYLNISAEEIINLENSMTDELINSTHGDGNEIPKYSILVFKTGDGNYGKMQILNNTVEEKILEFRYDLFNSNTESLIESELSTVQRTYTFDFETNIQAARSKDFWWEWNEFNNGGQDGEDKFLVPRDNCIFHVYLN